MLIWFTNEGFFIFHTGFWVEIIQVEIIQVEIVQVEIVQVEIVLFEAVEKTKQSKDKDKDIWRVVYFYLSGSFLVFEILALFLSFGLL